MPSRRAALVLCIVASTPATVVGFCLPSSSQFVTRHASDQAHARCRGSSRRSLSMQRQTTPDRRVRTSAVPPAPPASDFQSSRKTSSSSVRELSSQMKDMQRNMNEQNPEIKAYMDAMRGAALSDFDVAQGEMRLVDFDINETEQLPMTYEPEVLNAYYAARPHLAWQRTLQLGSAFSGFMFSLLSDRVRGKGKQNEVLRAAQLRSVIILQHCTTCLHRSCLLVIC
jgi:hypothetical protein